MSVVSDSRPQSLVFLFGSGISTPAGLPSTSDISGKLLPPRDFFRHTWNVYTFDWNNERLFDPQRPERDSIIAAVEAARDLTALGFRRLDIPVDGLNYEDVLFTLSQLHAAESGGRDDPMLATGRRFIERRLRGLPTVKRLDLLNLLADTLKCMTDLVVEMLYRLPTGTEHLRFLDSASDEIGPDGISVVTTNQDRLLETHWRESNTQFDDGFSGPINGARLWKPEQFFGREGRVQLLKIHGSIDWYDMMPPEDWRFNGEIATLHDPKCNLERYRHPDGRIWHTRKSQPEILIGTLNKTESYTSGIFAELFCRWRSALMSTRSLLVCGYGFRDNGINRLLVNWAYQNRDRRMVVVTPDFDGLLNSVKPGMARCLKEWQANDVLVLVECGVEDLVWDTLKDALIP